MIDASPSGSGLVVVAVKLPAASDVTLQTHSFVEELKMSTLQPPSAAPVASLVMPVMMNVLGCVGVEYVSGPGDVPGENISVQAADDGVLSDE